MWRRDPGAPAAEAFDRLPAWDDPALCRALAWYRLVATNRRPAKYLIAATVPADVDLGGAEESLWAGLEHLTPAFLERWDAIRRGAPLPPPARGPSLLDLVAALGWRMLAHCNFCRWDCRVDRARGTKVGACRLAAATRVGTWFHHPGEELVYRGTHGSGTIFFTSCNMRCAFCQNGDISTDKDNGDEVDPRTLAAMAWALRAEGCHNVNWVGGEVTIHLHAILEAIRLLGTGVTPTRDDLARAVPTRADRWAWHDRDPHAVTCDGRFNAPMLWNSNFFMSEEAMRLLRIVVDVWLPDFKLGPGDCAMRLARTPWYW
jgi:putative pyruvate formate lyase activating enzyme